MRGQSTNIRILEPRFLGRPISQDRTLNSGRIGQRFGLAALLSLLALLNAGCAGLVSGQAANTTPAALQVSTNSLPAGQQDVSYQTALSAAGGAAPYTWSLTSGSLPSGLSLNASSGAISGTPSTPGNSTFTAQVSDAKSNKATKSLNISIAATGTGPQPLQITTTSLPQVSANQPLTITFQATGGTPSYTWSIVSGSLPAGLSLTASTGQIAGTVTTVGSFSFTVQVKDSAPAPATATQALTLTVVAGVALDQYGGRTDLPCAQATGWFHTEEINSRWWLCTPAGNAFFMQAIGTMSVPETAKYGCSGSGTCVSAANAIFDEMKSWNFNAVGDNSYGAWTAFGGSCNGTCGPMPQLFQDSAGEYSIINLGNSNFAPQPVKDLSVGMGQAAGPTNSFLDYFDPNFKTFVTNYFANWPATQGYRNNPWIIGLAVDGADYFYGVGAGPDFDTFPPGKNNTDLGYMVLISSPIQAFNSCTEYGCQSLLYSDPKVYSKTAMANAPGACSIAMPCSLRDYLAKKYGTIAALNAAWGSNYTTFDSSGSRVTGEVIATGNGTQAQFIYLLAKSPVSKHSVQLLLNGTPAAADCSGCNVGAGQASFAGTGALPSWQPNSSYASGAQVLDSNGYVEKATNSGSSGSSAPTWSKAFDGATAEGTISWSNNGPTLAQGISPWLSAIDCTGSGSIAAANYWVLLTYHFANGSTEAPTPSIERETVVCNAGKQVNVYGADGAAGSQPNPAQATGIDVYAACQVASGNAANGCAAAGGSAPTPTLQASNIPIVAVTSITYSAGVATATVSSTAGVSVGQPFTAYKTVGPISCDQSATVTAVLNNTQFTYPNPQGLSNCSAGGTISFGWTPPSTGLVNGAAVPGAPSFLTYATGQTQLTFTAPPQNGVTIAINYVANGWGYGTGLMDEDGTHTAWLGTNGTCLLPVANASTPGTDSYACRPGNPGGFSTPNANANLAADIAGWDAQFAGQYFSAVRAGLKASNPNLLYFGVETLGTWGAPPSKWILQAANQYTDAVYTAWWANEPSNAVASSQYSYYSQYYTGPLVNLAYLTACPDSAVAQINPSCGGVFYENSQQARGQEYNAIVSGMLTQASYNNTYQWIGIDWWQLHDCDGPDNPTNNWGLKTCLDNAYDGHEAVTASVPCSDPLGTYACGGEQGNYGDAITEVKSTNQLWKGVH